MKLITFDSTLRDGEQAEGIDYSIDDKLSIIKILDDLQIDFIEVGNPYSSIKDKTVFELSKNLNLTHSKLVAFGSTRHKNTLATIDKNLEELLLSGVDSIAIFGKCSVLHVKNILQASLEENLSMIFDSVKFLKDHNKFVIFDAEHFFDGYKDNSVYALSCIDKAILGGASYIALCDTNGGSFPDEVAEITRLVKNLYPNTNFGIHCHNDGGFALANTFESVKNGFTMVQGTLLGFGERCGNTNLSTLICALQLKRDYYLIPLEKIKEIYVSAIKIAEISNISISPSEPYIGTSAFSHKAGMHTDGVLKNQSSFEHINPELVGNKRKFLLSDMAGRSAIMNKISRYFPQLKKDSLEMTKIIDTLKNLSAIGYLFEPAEASFILTVKKILGEFTPAFELINFKCINEQPAIENKVASAIIKIRVNGKTKITASDGEGPVHAIDLALREALSEFYPQIKNITLKDYKVRVLAPKDATASKVRVLITSTNGSDIWTTVGVSDDIIEASYIALTDSIEYSLL